MSMLFFYQNMALFLYALLKAFLPLPSLEVVLLPLCLKLPQYWLLFCLIGSLGTMVGGAIGYALAYRFGRGILRKMASAQDIDKGERMMKRYGVLAVIIGGITPIPDFLLAYLAGIMKMPPFQFLISDGIARGIRSLIVCYGANRIAAFANFDRYFNLLAFAIVVFFLFRFFKEKRHVATLHKK